MALMGLTPDEYGAMDHWESEMLGREILDLRQQERDRQLAVVKFHGEIANAILTSLARRMF